MRGCTGVAFSAALCRDLQVGAVEVLNSWASLRLFVISRSLVQLPPPFSSADLARAEHPPPAWTAADAESDLMPPPAEEPGLH